ncbi:MAG: hypothetical protein J1E61_11040 [Lachnospiraceae bacterium]|nr:hypothetical protein [Lachnospiraceae bacterium]
MEENKNPKEDGLTPIEDDIEIEKTVEEGENKKPRRSMTSTKNGLYLRTIIGGVILYYVYGILSEISATPADKRTLLYVLTGIMAVAGIWVILDSIKKILKKEYDE